MRFILLRALLQAVYLNTSAGIGEACRQVCTAVHWLRQSAATALNSRSSFPGDTREMHPCHSLPRQPLVAQLIRAEDGSVHDKGAAQGGAQAADEDSGALCSIALHCAAPPACGRRAAWRSGLRGGGAKHASAPPAGPCATQQQHANRGNTSSKPARMPAALGWYYSERPAFRPTAQNGPNLIPRCHLT